MECISCHTKVKTEDSFVKFKCPSCQGADIIRCQQCRKKSTPYKCKNCGFEGP